MKVAIYKVLKIYVHKYIHSLKRDVNHPFFAHNLYNFYITIFAFTDDSVNSILLSKPTILRIDFI